MKKKTEKPKQKPKWPQYGWTLLYANGRVGTVYESKGDAIYFSGFAASKVIEVEIGLVKRKAKP